MSKRSRPPRYRLVTDTEGRHRGVDLVCPGLTYGSSRPLVAAVLQARPYVAPGASCDCARTCTCPKVWRWVVSRMSFTRLAAETYCDQLRGRGLRACVVPMTPAAPAVSVAPAASASY